MSTAQQQQQPQPQQQQQQQQEHSFIKETIEPSLSTTPTTVANSSTPEPSRRYVQWKEDDVGLLLTDLEQPGHYNKWKENKSGFSKRVAEQVFKNGMYHEAVKFKVRWLESRFKLWNQQLTSPQVEQDEPAIKNFREKMMKEFPYYDRCKPIFDQTTYSSSNSTTITIGSPVAVVQQQQHQSTLLAPVAVITAEKEAEEEEQKPAAIQMANELSSPTLITSQQEDEHRCPFTDNSNNKRHLDSSSASTAYPTIKKRAAATKISSKPTAIRPNADNLSGHSSIYLINNNDSMMTEERKVKMMELELELKKMDHQERMQEMKLEQLRLEIELQKLKRDTPIAPTIQNNLL